MENAHLQNHHVNLGMIIKNIILGGQDGLVNVLGIVLGVATATASTEIVLLSGLAATFAESVSMAAVAYTSTKAEEEHYESELKKETREIEETPQEAREEIRRIYIDKGFSGELLEKVVNQITKNKEVWLKTMMKDELGLQNPKEEMSALNQGILVGISAFIGSLVPLAPFIFMNVNDAFYTSLGISL
jgi:VIT1/CCC1 family predicted Fe2+/Mn2+ transporter